MSDIDAALSALSIEVDKPRRMPLLHFETGLPLVDANGNPAWVDVYSNDSEIVRRHDREVLRRIFKAQRQRTVTMTPEENEANQVDVLVKLTAGWFLLTPSGQPIEFPFTPENARRLYSSPSTNWIRQQVDEFSKERGNFMQASLSSSSSGPRPSSARAEKQ
jgi:hypothetical protein